MKLLTITIEIDNTIETATVECNRKTPSLTFEMKNGLRKTYAAYDLFVCFGMLRAEHPKIKFLCKGAKLNVHPSRMSSQMSNGLVAYELKLGKSSEEEDMVRIFDYDNENITSDIKEQISFYKKWTISLAQQ
ncbi:hypothetical protein ACW9HW_27155 [Pseudomonas sp. SDO5532_S415]